MSILQGSAKSVSADGGFYPLTINQSLRLNDNDSAYLSRTPSSAGNQKTWTFSCWFKAGNLGINRVLLACRVAGTDRTVMRLNSDNTLFIIDDDISWQLVTTQVFRDTSAWYHLVLSVDTTQATASNRVKVYINGSQVTSFSTATYPSLNYDTRINSTATQYIGFDSLGDYFDGYMGEVHLTDGTAYNASAFGEFKSGVWVAKTPSVTYGTNGFYLPFNSDYAVEGFNALTYRGNGSTQYIGGAGFSPDLVWIKDRTSAQSHSLIDSVRGGSAILQSNETSAEVTTTALSFANDGFMLESGNALRNYNGDNYVAWCWDAGTGSPVSNTDGSITSTVKANTAQGFSIITAPSNSGSAYTVGHGLSQAPELIIGKGRTTVDNWMVYTSTTTASKFLSLNQTSAENANSTIWNGVEPTSSVFSVGTNSVLNSGTSENVFYAFHSVAGYSKIGSYTGNYSTTGPVITTGFKPAFVLIKNASALGNWHIFDSSRSVSNPVGHLLFPNDSSAEYSQPPYMEFTDTGFSILTNDTGKTGCNINQPSNTYIYMAFADTRDASFFLDQSGNNNDWTPNVLTESDVMLDSPTNNFATLNKLAPSNIGLSDGNLRTAGGTGWQSIGATMAFNSGKYYWEMSINGTLSSTEYRYFIGCTADDDILYRSSGYVGDSSTGHGLNIQSDQADYWTNSTNTTSLVTAIAQGDVVQCVVDADNGKGWFGVKDSWVGGGNPSTGTSPTFTFTAGKWVVPHVGHYNAYYSVSNFGQDSSFAGTKTSQGYTDANGIGDFYYPVPDGALALCTSNLPEPAISPADGASPTDYMNTVLYTGDGTSSHAITGVGFQPDLVWIKPRNAAYNHRLYDTVRGATKVLSSNVTNAEATNTSALTAFDSDGFTVGNAANENESGKTYVAWNWLAGGTAVSNTDGSITTTVSANTTSGFSIFTYTGTGNYATLGHGLDSAPEMVIIKQRNYADSWGVYHASLGNTKALFLNSTGTGSTSIEYWQNTTPTDSVISIGRAGVLNNDPSKTYVGYAFHSVEGFSKIGSYVGNGSADGPMVFTGHRPAWILFKNISDGTVGWYIYDTVRETYNLMEDYLQANSSAAETQGNNKLDMLSNGFKIRTSGATINQSGSTIIYMSFSSNPFKYSNAR